ncbi:MAG: 50S ribosomal protein L9 [Gammaproteobacteria bacterium]|nr:50S ribosomal protein L9 [Gammaproteobacteria bacterium]MCP4091129.1 50S ribosomal protein L9 [Gammaproteobacteria bacterium]MCP4277345.1 50S ribosomal protein L9 [Gammaproteobacteria bacterium]MCP4831594.1 50S ribosomal protein L9 [Gammaproteobacteria bacterium]MCP4927817.1 50S ribosomal protein L9 [Gammaproteobacteria bacterium]
MEVILLEKVENLGNIGEKVSVKAGYGRNFLLPQGKATVATAENLAIFEARRAELEAKQAEEIATAKGRAKKLEGIELSVTAKSGVEGKLFGSLGTIDIAEAAAAAGHEIERSEVRLPDGPLKAVGVYDIEIHLQADLNVFIKVHVVGDQDVDPMAEPEAESEEKPAE